MADPLVSTDWLAAHLHDPKVLPIDASWYLPAAARDPRAEFMVGHIPGAVFFDIDGVADKSTNLPHMLLAPDAFAEAVGALGVGDGMTLVIYDEAGLFSAPRVWWEFSAMGAPDIRLLEGGGPKWRSEGRPLEAGPARRPPTRFTARFVPGLVRNFDDVSDALQAGSSQLIDARPADRFSGRAPEPRPGLASGHMPGALNVPATALVEHGTLKSPESLRALFAEQGVDLTRPIITTCGSGVTASTLALALQTAGATDIALYDGSSTLR